MRQPRTPKTLYPLDAGAPDKAAAKANQACHSCKRQKRKCDKALPACGLCKRMSRPCDYSDIPPAPTAEDIMTLQLKLFELESRLNSSGSEPSLDALDGRSEPMSRSSHTPQLLPAEPLWEGGSSKNFPSAAFLDGGLFRRAGLYIPRPLYNVPTDIFQCVGDRDSVQQAVSDYFDDIHPWIPMVSKKRMCLDDNTWDGGVDLPLLYLTMKLITSQPRAGFEAAENYLYTASKRFLSLLESTGTASILHLQAMILVALYEYGQGIYPAAWMTAGQCVRYADYLGLPSYGESNDVLGQCATWIEVEERRRTWWAVYVVDKLVSIGSRKRPLYSEPLANEVFPVDDGMWELGDISGAIQGPVSSPFTEQQSPFGRLCQGALLLSRTIDLSKRAEARRLKGEGFDLRAVQCLSESAHALSTSIQTEMTARPAAYFHLLPAQYLAYSAMLRTFNICTTELPDNPLGAAAIESGVWTENDLGFQMACIEGRKKTAAQLLDLMRSLLSVIGRDEEMVKTSPLVLDAVYSAATAFLTAWKDGSDPNAEAGLATAKKLLGRLSGRWRLAVEYLKALDHHEMIDMFGQNFSGGQEVSLGPLPTSIATMPTIVS